MAGVNMRLKPGGYRELHYHKEAEWGFMIAGKARVTALDTEGRPFVDDVEAGDIWNFPAGIPHSIQGLGTEGCEFLLVFDDANFSENETFLISDWFAHTPATSLPRLPACRNRRSPTCRPTWKRPAGSSTAPNPPSPRKTRSGARRVRPHPLYAPLPAAAPAKAAGGTDARRGFAQFPRGLDHRGCHQCRRTGSDA
ncbi:cupin domain-containing protein [Komagataeibacter rhaeticus]|nr:cupin domain-containing protein [Komagataeibacter rhaeticus]